VPRTGGACRHAAAHIFATARALSRFLAWFAREAQGSSDEIDTVEKLESFAGHRRAQKDVSFDSISGAGPHGAIVPLPRHQEDQPRVELDQLFLIDSGAQFVDGTTTSPRTVAVGKPSAEMRDRFTRVAEGPHPLALARFPEGRRARSSTPFARRPLWMPASITATATATASARIVGARGSAEHSPRGTRRP